MSKIKRCLTCGGTKYVMGMGLIKKECSECKGIGHFIVEEENKDADKKAGSQQKKAGEAKKRGRKKKEI